MKIRKFVCRQEVLEVLNMVNIQTLKRHANENKKNTQTQTEKFKATPTSPLNYEIEEK